MIAISKQETRVRWEPHLSRSEEVVETLGEHRLRKRVLSTLPEPALQALDIREHTYQHLPYQ